MHMSLTRIYL